MSDIKSSKWRFDFRSYSIGIIVMAITGPFFVKWIGPIIDRILP